MFDLFFAHPAAVAAEWYRWGVALGLAITVVVTSWVFLDSQRGGYRATYWRTFSLVAAMMVAPSAVLSFFPHLAEGLGDLPILLAYLGIFSAVIALLTLVLYVFGVGVRASAAVDDDLDLTPPPATSAPAATSVTPPPFRPSGAESTGRVSPARSAVTPAVPGAAPTDDRTQRLQPLAAEPEPLAWLVVMAGPQAGRELRLGRLTDIGREAGRNDIALDDPAISRQHARIRLEKGEFVLYDLASANGVSVNGERIQRQALANGDRILVGQTELGFMIVAEE